MKIRKIKKRMVALILTLSMVLGLLPSAVQVFEPVRTEAAGLTLTDLQNKFPNGAYWNHVVRSGHGYYNGVTHYGPCNNPDGYTWSPCTTHSGTAGIGGYDCNSEGGGVQCCGFARKLALDVYGSYPSSWKTTSKSNIKPGDVMHYYGAGADATYGHWVMIIARNGNTVTLGECNVGGRCKIQWGRTLNLSSIARCTVYSSPSQLPVGGNTQQPSLKVAASVSEMKDTKQAEISGWRTETNWGVFSWILNPARSVIGEIGINLYDANNNPIGHKHENYPSNINTQANAYMYYNINSELGVTLQPGTTYKYRMYAYVNGNRLESDYVTFTTKGDATPATPSLSINKTEYGINENIQINWQKYNNATGFKVRIQGINNTDYDRTIDVNNGGATFTSFMLNKSGEYKVEVQAINASKNSGVAKLSSTIKVHENVSVSFVMEKDGEESILKTQEIMWGKSATPPSAPTLEGHSFQGWSGSYENIKEDKKLIANFKRNSYKIQFVDVDQETGKDTTVLKSENVLYQDSATPPKDPVPQKVGYVFAGWNSKDYENVKGNCTIRPTYVWGNVNLPIVANATSCKFEDEVYKVHVKLTNYPDAKTVGRIVVAMKTKDGKLLETTESDVFVLEADSTQEIDVIVPYKGMAAYADVIVVKDYTSIIPLSKNSSVDVYREWSEWSTVKPEGSVEVEERLEYRTRKKEYSTSTTSSTKIGWTLYDTKTSWGEYGSWSNWSRTAFVGSDSRQVQTQNVSDNNGYTTETYYFYKVPGKLDFYPYDGGGWEYREYTWNSSNPNSIRPHSYKVLEGAMSYALGDFTWGAYYGWELWWLKNIKSVPATSHTEYRYRDRNLVNTYHFYKWGEWDEWVTSAAVTTDDTQVEQRTVYRSKDIIINKEDEEGTQRTVSGKVSTEFAGKQATLFVYKNDDAADYNNEYVGQTVIGNDGSYSFTFKTREEPSEKTGDFIINLSIEGATDKIYIDTIKAPKPVYNVTFVDYDGNVLSTQQVEEGDNAILPENPTRKDYNFIGWDTGITNIHDDLTITAQYEKVKYTVIYVDWEKQDISFEQYTVGSDLAAPVETTREGYTFSNWLDEEGNVVNTVTRDMVLTAQYTINKYNVSFYDQNGSLISEQVVEYGKSAMIPEVDEIDNMVFSGWRTNGSYINVVGNVEAHAQYSYICTSDMPIADKTSGKYETEFSVTLTAATDAAIYYTTDGSEPTVNSNLYEAPINIDKNTVLRYIAVEKSKNISEIGTQVYLITANEDMDGAVIIKNNILNLKVEDASPTALSVYCSNDDAKINYYSVNEDVATVTEDGQVQARNVGDTTIFAITDDFKYAAACTVNVTTDVVEVETIKLNKESASVMVGNTISVEAEVYPQAATYKDVLWFSSDSDVATVDAQGNIKAVSEGTACITAYSYTGSCYINCTVEVMASGLSILDDEIDMEVGNTYTLEALYDGVNISEGITWKSSKTDVVTVENGMLTAKGEGTAVITCSNNEGDVETVIVNVYKKGELPSKNPQESEQPSQSPNVSDNPSSSDEPSESPKPSQSPDVTDEPDETNKPDDTDEYIKGDIDGNGKVQLMDAQKALKAALNIELLDEAGQKAADVDGNGKIQLLDVQMILKAALNIISL